MDSFNQVISILSLILLLAITLGVIGAYLIQSATKEEEKDEHCDCDGIGACCNQPASIDK